MGLFGKKFDSSRIADGFAAAQATLHGDYGAAMSIHAQGQRRREQEAQAQAEAQAMQAVRAGLHQRGYTDSDIDVLMADPRQAAALVQEVLKPRQAGPEGMTMRNVDPVSGTVSYETSPGWHGSDYFGGSNGEQAPERIYQGERVFPVEKGGSLGVYGGPQGQQAPPQSEVMGWNPSRFGADAARNPDDAPTTEEGYDYTPGPGGRANPQNWKPSGGASRRGSRTFP